MAVIVQPHLRLSWGGYLGKPGLEVWTNSVSLTGVADLDSEKFNAGDLIEKIGECATAIQNWMTRVPSQINNLAALTWVKFNRIDAAGKYADNPNTLILPTPIVGGQSGVTLFQQSQVISLRTGAARGRGSKGRIYPPCCGGGVDADGYMNEGAAEGIQASAVTLIGDINKIHPGVPVWDGLAPRWNVCIVSNGVNGKPPLLTPVTHLYVDRIPDVQRRRVNRVAPAGVAPTSVYINT